MNLDFGCNSNLVKATPLALDDIKVTPMVFKWQKFRSWGNEWAPESICISVPVISHKSRKKIEVFCYGKSSGLPRSRRS